VSILSPFLILLFITTTSKCCFLTSFSLSYFLYLSSLWPNLVEKIKLTQFRPWFLPFLHFFKEESCIV
jgi:hypothetical protein